MQYRRLGRSGLEVSVVGFGTCQLRLVPEKQGLETLRRGFELGVNFVHTAPDYEGADDLVAQAVRESGREVIVCSQGYGPMVEFDRLFEATCVKLGRDRLDIFGVACVDDREALGENLWGRGGMVEFLQRKKAEGRLRATFCTTHGPPEYVAALLEKDVFDVVMLAYNPLGFHILTYHPGPGEKPFESVPRNPELFPLFRERDVGLMVMKPLAGGLLCPSPAFPPHAELRPRGVEITAADVFRSILAHPEVACVVPGTASVAEAEENARAGHGDLRLPDERQRALAARVKELQATVCSRCGGCEDSCSQHLPVSFMFRSGYVGLYPSATFETPPQYEYFKLHPSLEATCATCPDVTCICPAGIDIPASLIGIHGHMRDLSAKGRVPPPGARLDEPRPEAWAAAVVLRGVPARLTAGESASLQLHVANTGQESWLSGRWESSFPRVSLELEIEGRPAHREGLREHVHPGCRGHFTFEFPAPPRAGRYALALDLVEEMDARREGRRLRLHEGSLEVEA